MSAGPAPPAHPRFDLQAHSHHSDGALSPAEVVNAAAAAGVELLALTDHDSVDGVAEAIAAAEGHGIDLLAAAEISALHDEHEDLHILGYGLDPDDAGLLSTLTAYRQDRLLRADRMAQALREVGWAVLEETLQERRASGRSVGRPHLARAVFDHPQNADRIAREGLENPGQLLAAYLIPGAPAYRGRTRPRVPEAIEVIHRAGGVAVWAHPFWDIDDPQRVEQTLRNFAEQGLDGVEAFYVTHDAEQTRLLAGLAADLGLLSTGSSDFHGPEHPLFSGFLAHKLYGLTPRLGSLPAAGAAHGTR